MIDKRRIIESLGRVISAMGDNDVDLWMTFTEETIIGGDQLVLDLLGNGVVGETALMVTRGGEKVAVLAHYDVDQAESLGIWDVHSYTENIFPELDKLLSKWSPRKVAINMSPTFVAASGLRASEFERIDSLLDEHGCEVVPSDPLVIALHSAMGPDEIEAIVDAIKETEKILEELTYILKPGIKEKEVEDFIDMRVGDRALGFAWERASCPGILSGEFTSHSAHMPAKDKSIEKGELLVVDFGVQKNGFVSDLQRVWYMSREGESSPPKEMVDAFNVGREAVELARSMMLPGTVGVDIDNAVKGFLQERGFPSYPHCTGHPVGRSVHDIGALIGPDTPRYRKKALYKLQENQVYAIEPSVIVDERFGFGIEEDIQVTKDGGRYLSNYQREIWVV